MHISGIHFSAAVYAYCCAFVFDCNGLVFQVVAGTVETTTVSHILPQHLKQLHAHRYVKTLHNTLYACNEYYFTRVPIQLGCCARAGTLLPAFTCPTTEPVCATPFTLSGDGGNPNGGGSSNNTSAGNGGSPSINSMATMFTSFLLAAVALLFHS